MRAAVISCNSEPVVHSTDACAGSRQQLDDCRFLRRVWIRSDPIRTRRFRAGRNGWVDRTDGWGRSSGASGELRAPSLRSGREHLHVDALFDPDRCDSSRSFFERRGSRRRRCVRFGASRIRGKRYSNWVWSRWLGPSSGRRPVEGSPRLAGRSSGRARGRSVERTPDRRHE